MTRPIGNTTRENHAETIDSLLDMLTGIRVTLGAKEKIGSWQRSNAISVLSSAMSDLMHCRSSSHIEIVEWLADLKVDLQLMEGGTVMGQIDDGRIMRGQRLVDELSSCRESLVSYR